jgi:antitoxin component HigA of HigAB toxin-antitoxin module
MNEPEYNAALQRIEELIDCDPNPGSTAGKELEQLVNEVMDYEKDWLT